MTSWHSTLLLLLWPHPCTTPRTPWCPSTSYLHHSNRPILVTGSMHPSSNRMTYRWMPHSRLSLSSSYTLPNSTMLCNWCSTSTSSSGRRSWVPIVRSCGSRDNLCIRGRKMKYRSTWWRSGRPRETICSEIRRRSQKRCLGRGREEAWKRKDTSSRNLI